MTLFERAIQKVSAGHFWPAGLPLATTVLEVSVCMGKDVPHGNTVKYLVGSLFNPVVV